MTNQSWFIFPLYSLSSVLQLLAWIRAERARKRRKIDCLQWMDALAQRYDDEKIVMSQDEYDAIYNQDYLDMMENEDRQE